METDHGLNDDALCNGNAAGRLSKTYFYRHLYLDHECPNQRTFGIQVTLIDCLYKLSSKTKNVY